MDPRHFNDLDGAVRAGVTRLFFDVDDTLTWHGQLPEVAASALYKANAFGISLVAVTGLRRSRMGRAIVGAPSI